MNRVWIVIIGFLLFTPVQAGSRIAILDFELLDLTLAPRIPAELQRTAGVKPLLETELKKAGYSIIHIDLSAQQQANQGVGYLFDHDDDAVALAKKASADYVLVGRLHKPSFLFAYLMGHLLRVSDQRLLGNYISEVKGGDHKLTLKGVESLAVKIDQDLDKMYTPPAPQR
ncbi:MAG: DUF2380 domain-containing protein [Methylococcales bacterium]